MPVGGTSALRAATIAFTTAGATLAAQILFHRIISAKLLNNYAFLVISLTMLGFASSGVILSLYLSRWLDRFNDIVALWTALFVLSSVGSSLIFYHAAIGSQRFTTRGEFVSILCKTIPYALLFAIPFVFSGLLLGMLLSSPRLPTRRIYCWDLVGSACGAVAVLPAISRWGVETTLLAGSGLVLAAVFAVAWPVRPVVGWIGVVAAVAVAVSLGWEKRLFVFRYPEATLLAAAAHPESGVVIEHTSWDPIARTEVSRIPPPDPAQIAFPSLIGGNPSFLARFKRVLTQNNFAFTYAVEYDGRPGSLEGIEETIYSAAYVAATVPKPSVAIIGVGGGFDVLTALHFQARDIVGVEVNGATLKILTNDYADYFRPWVADRRVKLVHEEGRHFLQVTDRPFDIIQLSGVDSYSGTPGAAHVFSENYLYTLEAFELYFARLSSNGVFNVMRLEHSPPREMLRALTTAVAALRRAGIERPAEHIAMVSARDGHFTALLVKKTPFRRSEEERLTQWVSTNRFFQLAAAPGWAPAERNFYQTFLALGDSAAERAYYSIAPYNIVPSTDDAPFFFKFSRWSHLFSSSPLLRRSVPVMEISLIVMLILIGLAALLCIWWPLRSLTRRLVATAPKKYGLIFAGTAVAYLAVEIALLQKFGLYLGHPNYALSIVLAELLFATGIGSLLSSAIGRWLRGPRFVSYLLALVLILECVVAIPGILRGGTPGLGIRVPAVLALIMPLGLLMGTFVPTALEQLKNQAPEFVPWAWGINGVFSVFAPVLSVAFSMTWGIDALLLSAVPLYLVVGWLFPRRSVTPV